MTGYDYDIYSAPMPLILAFPMSQIAPLARVNSFLQADDPMTLILALALSDDRVGSGIDAEGGGRDRERIACRVTHKMCLC